MLELAANLGFAYSILFFYFHALATMIIVFERFQKAFPSFAINHLTKSRYLSFFHCLDTYTEDPCLGLAIDRRATSSRVYQ